MNLPDLFLDVFCLTDVNMKDLLGKFILLAQPEYLNILCFSNQLLIMFNI